MNKQTYPIRVSVDSKPPESEYRRIMEAYARRDCDGRDEGSYFEHEDPAHLLRIQQRYRTTLKMLNDHGVNSFRGRKILDIGCGNGATLLAFLQWGGEQDEAAGIDLREEPLARARTLLPGADIRQGCATNLPWPDEFFDLVSLNTVLSSILDPAMRRQVAAQAAKVLKQNGMVIVYDMFRDNPRNPDVMGISADEIRNLFPGFQTRFRPITFLPHIARRVPVKLLEPIYSFLTSVPYLCTHYLSVLKKNSN